LAKIAVKFGVGPVPAAEHVEGRSTRRRLAQGEGWSVSDVVCSAGPRDRPFEEQHPEVCIAVVISGSFQYRSSPGRELMTSGSLLLGNAGQYFECGHEHGIGDRCIAFSYDREFFEGLAEHKDMRAGPRFSALRVPPVREFSSLVARARASLDPHNDYIRCHAQGAPAAKPEKTRAIAAAERGTRCALSRRWEEISVELAGQALDFARGGAPNRGSSLAAEARVTRIVRMIESRPGIDHELSSLAQEAKLSRYHFLRMFRQLAGLTPHQYVIRVRLRRAATQLLLEPSRVLDVALDSGFGDVSNFNHAFRAEFGVSPRAYRKLARVKETRS
jgi:AraC family transcriptional regulator